MYLVGYLEPEQPDFSLCFLIQARLQVCLEQPGQVYLAERAEQMRHFGYDFLEEEKMI